MCDSTVVMQYGFDTVRLRYDSTVQVLDVHPRAFSMSVRVESWAEYM
jgi:hypothetical protein